MRPFTIVSSLFILISSSRAAPTGLSQTTIIDAGGDVPEGGPAIQLSSNGVSNFQLANFIENIESQFFAQALTALATDIAFTTPGPDGLSVQDVITKVAAQELVHKATVEGALTGSGAVTIGGCTKVDTVSSTAELLARANVSCLAPCICFNISNYRQIITSSSIGGIIAIEGSVVKTDPGLITSASSILGSESRHDAFFRQSEGAVPNPAPFETAISAIWAYNLILGFVDPGSCPTLLPIQILPELTISSPPPTSAPPKIPPTIISFTVNQSIASESSNLFIGWVNQANAPVYTIATVSSAGQGTAPVPGGLNGAAFAALTNQNTATSVDALTSATLAGPAVVVIS